MFGEPGIQIIRINQPNCMRLPFDDMLNVCQVYNNVECLGHRQLCRCEDLGIQIARNRNGEIVNRIDGLMFVCNTDRFDYDLTL